MTTQLTIKAILEKHLVKAPRGTISHCAKELGVEYKHVARWLSGVCTPSGDYAVKLLQHFGELKNYPNIQSQRPGPKEV